MLPNEHLIQLNKDYPEVWRGVEELRAGQRKDLLRWPTWCFVPMAGWYALVSRANNTEKLELSQVKDVSALAAIGTWRYSQGIYRFDPEFYNAVLGTTPSSELPVEVLYRLLEWCIYVETQKAKWFGAEAYGFWCHLEWDANTERHELRLLLNSEKALIPIVLHLGKWTITEAVDRALTEAKHQADLLNLSTDALQGMAEDIGQNLGILSLVLYLCSNEPEIVNERQPQQKPERPRAKHTKAGWKLFPASKPTVWTIGASIGQRLRAARTEGESTHSVTLHLRRAHWHGFWTGPLDSERKFTYRWLPPIFVQGTKNIDVNSVKVEDAESM